MIENYDKFLHSVIVKGGKVAQTAIAMEECAELIQAISKMFRNPDKAHLVEELADVRIMTDKIKIMYDITDEEVNEIISQKMNRTIDRLDLDVDNPIEDEKHTEPLKNVKEVHYKPFNFEDPEVRKALIGKVLVHKRTGYRYTITGFRNSEKTHSWSLNGDSGENILRLWTFEDGTPCGELVSDGVFVTV